MIEQLREECGALRRSGKIREAKRLEARMSDIRARLPALPRVAPIRIDRRR